MQTKIDDSVFAIPVFSSVCSLCAHLHPKAKRGCAAFPEEIPMEIWMGENPHTAPYPGDHGIQFQDVRKPVAEAA